MNECIEFKLNITIYRSGDLLSRLDAAELLKRQLELLETTWQRRVNLLRGQL